MATSNTADTDTAMLYISQASDCLEKSRAIISEELMTIIETEEESDENTLEAYEALHAKLFFLSDAVAVLLKNSFKVVPT